MNSARLRATRCLSKALTGSFLVTVAQEARKDKQYNAAINGIVQAAKVSGSYVETKEADVALVRKLEKLAEGRLEDLSDAEAEQFMHVFERLAWGTDRARIEAERRKSGLIEASATEIELQLETREKTV